MEFFNALILKIKDSIVYILIVVLLIILNDAFFILSLYSLKSSEAKIISSSNISAESGNKNNEFYVDVKGEVKKPGIYLVSSNMVVNDAIKLAGGLKKGASTLTINLSKKLFEEMVIVIPPKSKKVSVVNTKNDALITNEETSNIFIDNSKTPSGLVNINTATLDELLLISGVGESKAKAIISYREKNKFNTIDDVKNVSGIGDALFEKIKESITV